MSAELFPSAPYLLLSAVAYFLLNVRFLSLTCHQDAGWHSYWAAFRKQGVPLKRQLNVLMGCTRIASQYLFLMLFSVFGVQDPDILSRKVFLFFNFLAHLFLFAAIRILAPTDLPLAYIISGSYLLITSNPFWFFHYESGERWVNILHCALLIPIALYLTEGNSLTLLFWICFAMAALACFFKLSQGAEYLFLWFCFLNREDWMDQIAVSLLGVAAGVGLFLLFLRWKNLLEKENLGLFGYVKVSRKNNVEMSPLIRLAKKLPSTLMEFLKKFDATLIGRMTNFLLSKAQILRDFGPKILKSTLVPILLMGALFFVPSTDPSLEHIALFWFIGALAALFAQGTGIPIHFIPLAIPLAILSGLSVSTFSAAHPQVLPIVSGAAVLLMMPFAQRKKLDAALWPSQYKSIWEKNQGAAAIAPFIQAHSSPNDYVMIWGTVPQLYVQSRRRSPIPWLMTNAQRMDLILPNWRDVMFERLEKTQPVFLVDFEGDVNLAEIKTKAGLTYQLDHRFGGDRYAIYRRK